MADTHNLSNVIPVNNIQSPFRSAEAEDITTKIESGAICPSCLTEDCEREVKTRAIMMGEKKGYGVECCANRAHELQQSEDLRQCGIHAERIAGMYHLAGIPDRFRDAEFSTFKIDSMNEAAVRAALSLVNKFKQRETTGNGLVLVGPTGVGKTHLAVAILRQLIGQGIAGRYVYASDFIEFYRRPNEHDVVRYQTMRALLNERFLVLDDVGIERDSEFVTAQYTKLLDARYREKRPTVITSNLGLEDLGHTIGERSMSRLIEASEIVEMRGEDKRLRR